MTSRYQPAAGGLKPRHQTTVTCQICGFTLPRHHAVEISHGRWRHRELQTCEQKAAALSRADELLGGRR